MTEPTPIDWNTQDWNGSGEFTLDESQAHSGENSIRIDSNEGIDGAWNQTVEAESNSEYTLVGWIKTEDFDAGTGNGAQLNVHELGESSATEAVTGTQDWTQMSTTINTGENEEIQINALVGGWGESTGTAWFDGLALYDPDAEEDTEYSENLLPNPSFEAGDRNDIDGWGTDVYSGTVDEHFRTNEVSYAGDFGAGITATAEEGADAAWSIVGFQLEEGEEYIFTGHIKTKNVEAGEDSDNLSEDGAIVYLFQGDGSVTSGALTGTNDWTEVELQFEATQASGNVHLMQDLGGTARGTTWFDDLSLVRILSGDEDPLSDIYTVSRQSTTGHLTRG